MSKFVLLKALAFAAICFSMSFAQGGRPPSQSPPAPSGGGNPVAAYVFGGEEMRGDLDEDLADAIVNNLVADRRYSQPRRGAREFYREVDRAQARNRRQILSDRDFCRIGGDFGVQYVVIMDIERAGRSNSVWARILDLNNCVLVATAEYVGLIRNASEVTAAANSLSAELLHRRIGKRGGSASSRPISKPEFTGTYMIRTMWNRGVDIVGNNNHNAHTWEVKGQASQNFTFEHLHDNTYRIVSNNGMVLTATTSRVVRMAWANGENQKWRVTTVDGNAVTIQNALDGRFLDVQGGNNRNGVSLIVYPQNNTNAQRFRLVRP